MKLVGRISVEPLDDERWTNIERRVVTGASDAAERGATHATGWRGMRWALAAAALVVVVLGAGAIGWRMRGTAPSSVPTVQGGGEPLAVRTDRDHSTIDIGDATIASDPGAVFAVTRPGGGVLVAMTRGKVELEVGKRGARPPLVVRAGDTDVIVVGTHFSVDYGDGTGDVDVRVTEGVVRVVRRGAEARVAAGQAWTTKRGLVAAAVAATTAPAVPDKGDGSVALEDRTPRAPDAPPPGKGTGSAGKQSSGSDAGSARLDRADDPHLDLKTRIRAAQMLPPLDVGTRDPKAALDEYTRIFSSEKGQRAAHAMYSMAIVQYSKQGQAGEALETVDRLVKRFEGFEYRAQYAAALWLRVRIRCLASLDDACRHAAYIYLHQAKDGPAAALAEQITLAR